MRREAAISLDPANRFHLGRSGLNLVNAAGEARPRTAGGMGARRRPCGVFGNSMPRPGLRRRRNAGTRDRESKLEAVVTGSDKGEGTQAPSVNGRRPGVGYFVKILWRWACHAGAGAIEAPLCLAPLATPDRQSQLGLAYLATRSMFRSLNRLGFRFWGMPRQPRTEAFVS
jgi:hypothetical protein